MMRAGLRPSARMSTKSTSLGPSASRERRDLARVDGDEHRLVALEPLADEWQRTGEQVVGAVIEERFVVEHQGRDGPA